LSDLALPDASVGGDCDSGHDLPEILHQWSLSIRPRAISHRRGLGSPLPTCAARPEEPAVTTNVAPFSELAQKNPLHPLMLIVGILLAGVTAKLGHAMWGTGGVLALYPAYLAMLQVGRWAAAFVAA
jgi:hypothetical protein